MHAKILLPHEHDLLPRLDAYLADQLKIVDAHYHRVESEDDHNNLGMIQIASTLPLVRSKGVDGIENLIVDFYRENHFSVKRKDSATDNVVDAILKDKHYWVHLVPGELNLYICVDSHMSCKYFVKATRRVVFA